MMLDHIGQPDVAEKVHNAWLATLENGRVTYDLYREGQSREKLGTKEFGEAIAEHLGEKPKHLQPVQYFEKPSRKSNQELYGYSRPAPKKKELFGVDVFLHWAGTDPDQLAEQLNQAATNELELTMITNRGTKVYPGYNPETFCTDHWRCRFKSKSGNPIANPAVIQLLQSIYDKGLDFIKTEQLYEINGEPAFSKGQGE
jgi:isocitrate dehydrogenase